MPVLLTDEKQVYTAETDIYGTREPLFFMADVYNNPASAPEEGTSTDTQIMDDRSIKVTITRDDLGCEWAYENDVSVFAAVERKDSIINTGIEVFPKDQENEKDIKAAEFIRGRIIDLPNTISILNKNKDIFGWSLFKKDYIGKDPKRLVPLLPRKCAPIRDLVSGELGVNGVGKDLDPEHKSSDIAVIQDGSTPQYDQYGTVNYTQKYYYFTRGEIIYFNNNDRGKFIGVSPIRRILRLVEIKKTIENTLELIVRRFGPQFKVIIGNDNVNFTNVDLPASYLRNSTGDPVARSTARTNYKNDIFANVNTKIQNWANANTLVQILEYGVDIQTINPPSTLPDYIRYIDNLSNYIRMGILGVTPEGRVDITSASMREVSMKDLKDKANKERLQIISTLQKEYIDEILVANGYTVGQAYIKFKEIDKVDARADAEIERMKSETIANYIQRAGFSEVPKPLVDKWGISMPLDSLGPSKVRTPKTNKPLDTPGGGNGGSN